MQKGEYQVRVADEVGLSVSFVRAISSRSFDKKILHKIKGTEYRKSSSRVVAWDDTALEMQSKNVRPVNYSLLGRAASGAAKVEVRWHSHCRQQAWLSDGV